MSRHGGVSPRARLIRGGALATLVVLAVSVAVLVPSRPPPIRVGASSHVTEPVCNPPLPEILPVTIDNRRASFGPSEIAVPKNIVPNPNFLGSCRTAVITTAHVNEEVAAINHARRIEGVAPMRINAARFARLTGGEQILVVVDLERVARGLAPVAALTSQLDVMVAHDTFSSKDPVFVGWHLAGGNAVTAWASNWAGGLDVLGSDYIFMYDDGVGYNLECPTTGSVGCWAHRDNVLLATPVASSCNDIGGRAVLVMGAAVVPDTNEGRVGVGELFVTSCRGLPADTTFTWASAQRDLLGAKSG